MLNKSKELKAQRGYVEKDSFVRLDGSEVLVKRDWTERKAQLQERCEGRCERWTRLNKPHEAFCRGWGDEPHHIVPRSKGRDDRLSNLAWLSHWCHAAEDTRKARWSKNAKNL